MFDFVRRLFAGKPATQFAALPPPATPTAAVIARNPGLAPDGRSELSLFREKVRAATASGSLRVLPWLDNATRETPAMRRTYREMMKAPVIKAALLAKVFSVASLPLQSQPEDDTPRAKEVADSTRDGILNCDGGLLRIAETTLLPALISDHSISQKWEDPIPRGKWRGFLGLSRLQGLDTEDGPRVKLITDEHLRVTGVQPLAYNDQRIWPPQDFVILRYLSLYDSPHGMSDLRAVYAPYWRLDTVEKLRIIHLEKWTSPLLKGTYPQGDTGLKGDLETALEQAKSNTWFTVPEGVLVEAMQIAMRGEAEFQAAIADYKEEIALAIAGAFLQMLTSRGGGGDMRGDAKTQKGTAQLFVWYLAELLAQTITSQIAPGLVDANYASAGYPKFTLGSVDDADLLASANLDDILLNKLGLPLSRKAVASYYGRQLAADEADTLKPTQQATQPGQGAPQLPFADRIPLVQRGGPQRPFPTRQ